MCLLIFIFLIVYGYIEMLLFSYINPYIGGVGIFYEILLSILWGNSIQSKLKQSLLNGESTQISHFPLKYLGTLLLMFPGILSDIIGLLLQIPIFRQMIAKIPFTPFLKNGSSFFYYQSNVQPEQPSSQEQLYRYLNANPQSDQEEDLEDQPVSPEQTPVKNPKIIKTTLKK